MQHQLPPSQTGINQKFLELRLKAVGIANSVIQISLSTLLSLFWGYLAIIGVFIFLIVVLLSFRLFLFVMARIF